MKVKSLLVVLLLLVSVLAACGPTEEARFATALASEVTIYDYDGHVVDAQWLYDEFGNVSWTRVDTEEWPSKDVVYRLSELHAQCDYATLKVCIEDANGTPLNGISVVRYWPGAPVLPDFSDITQQWTSLGVYGKTEGEGCIGFGMGAGDYYWPDDAPSAGASKVYPADSQGPADLMSGLGMIAATNHCHLDLVYQLVSNDIPDPPTPTPPPTKEADDGIWNIDITIKGTIGKE